MPLCRPDTTWITELFFNRVFGDSLFVIQQHTIVSYFRILIVGTNYVIATAKTSEVIQKDWNTVHDLLSEHPVSEGSSSSSVTLQILDLFNKHWNSAPPAPQMGNNLGKRNNNNNAKKAAPPPKSSKEEVAHKHSSDTSHARSPSVSTKEPVKSAQPPAQKEPARSAQISSEENSLPPVEKAQEQRTSQPKQQAPPQNASAPRKATVNEAEAAEMIPLELAPNDIKIAEFIGEGVYSEVYKGYCNGTQVAVKKFKNQGLDAEVLKGVRKEVRIMKSIRHPNLLLFLGACTIPGHLMILTEILDKSFHDLNKTKVDLLTKIKMAKSAAKGISWLHSLNPVIIHRDLKPENILVGQNNQVVKVADFGLSLVKDQSKQEAEEMKKIRGSPAFMSPEALLGKELTPKTDVYSFGMILWELLTGGSPYESLQIESFEELIDEICTKGTRERIPKDCPVALRNLILACWKSEPSARPPFLSIIQQLDDAIGEVAISDKEGKEMWKRNFLQNGETITEVPWTSFLQAISMRLHMSPNLKIFQGLRVLLVKEGSGEVVSMEEFGNVLKWFGPMDAQSADNNFLARMQNIFTKRWFHGDISVGTAETRLAENEPGTFLIRFSSNPGSYALSKIIENQKKERVIVHIRIPHEPGKNYSFVLDDTVYEFDSLDDLVKEKVLGLTTACPGSHYYAQFRIKQIVSGYVNTVNQ